MQVFQTLITNNTANSYLLQVSNERRFQIHMSLSSHDATLHISLLKFSMSKITIYMYNTNQSTRLISQG